MNDGTWTYDWEHGRQLAELSNGTTSWTYTYNADGLRTKRTNGTTYYYALNLQGDVMAILNASGTAVVTYTYDAWGNILTTSGTMAATLGKTNALTYRGYVYDNETGLYYLQSRYYDPERGRFINADNYPSTGQGLTGNNMFAYCGNNPIGRQDAEGDFWGIVAAGVIASVISGIANAVSTAINGGTVEECVVSGLIGAGSAAAGFCVAAATGFSPAGNLLARGVASTICDLGTTYYMNGEITPDDALTAAVDVTFDVAMSYCIYSYTDPISNFTKQTIINSVCDGGVDVFETYFINLDETARGAASQGIHTASAIDTRHGGARKDYAVIAF